MLTSITVAVGPGIAGSMSKVSQKNPFIHILFGFLRYYLFIAISTYAPRVRSKVDVFINQLRARSGQPVNITEWTMFLTFDVMGVIGFGKDFKQLEDAKEHGAIKGLHEQMAILGLLAHLPWFLSLLASLPGLTGSYATFTDYCHDKVKEKEAVCCSIYAMMRLSVLKATFEADSISRGGNKRNPKIPLMSSLGCSRL
jgi:Cytochrome P450